jgi:quinoprotein glucose dehydrogenase
MTDDQRRDLLDFLMRRNQPAPPKAATAGPAYFADGWNFPRDQDGYPGCNPPWGLLNCIDLNTGRILWRVRWATMRSFPRKGSPRPARRTSAGPP